MMPMTPSGTRTRAISSPFASLNQRAASLPTGSGRAATCSRLAAIPSTRSSSRRSRSTKASVSPDASSTSRALAARMCSRRWRMAPAAALRASFLASVEVRARAPAAVRAAAASSAIVVRTVSSPTGAARTGATFRFMLRRPPGPIPGRLGGRVRRANDNRELARSHRSDDR